MAYRSQALCDQSRYCTDKALRWVRILHCIRYLFLGTHRASREVRVQELLCSPTSWTSGGVPTATTPHLFGSHHQPTNVKTWNRDHCLCMIVKEYYFGGVRVGATWFTEDHNVTSTGPLWFCSTARPIQRTRRLGKCLSTDSQASCRLRGGIKMYIYETKKAQNQLRVNNIKKNKTKKKTKPSQSLLHHCIPSLQRTCRGYLVTKQVYFNHRFVRQQN